MEKKRREKGSGSITQRKDGLWIGRANAGYKPNGSVYVRSVSGKTEAEARRKLRELIKEINKDEAHYVERSSVQSYMSDWLLTKKKNELKPKSYDRLEQTLEADVFPAIGNIQLQAISAKDVQRMVNDMRDAGRSYSTIKKAYDAVNSCFKSGLIQRTVNSNPALGVTIPNKKLFDTKEVPFYTKEEASALIEQAYSKWSNGKRRYPLGAFVPLIINTGLRMSELLALQWDRDVDLENRTITVHANMAIVLNRDKQPSSKYKYIEQKTVKSEAGQDRSIHLNDSAYDALLSLRDITGDKLYVMTADTSNLIKPRQIDQMFRRIATASGMPSEKIYGIHSLRHTFATLLLSEGVDIKTVSVLMGHADVKITYDTYIHVIKEQQKKAVSIIPDIIGKK